LPKTAVKFELGLPRAVLFDLDGTLIDSAPDLARAANAVRHDHGLPPLPLTQLRPMVGGGARGMIGLSFGAAPGDPDFERLRDAFLQHYAQGLVRETRVFDGIWPVLARLETSGIAWGIVTNKVTRFAEPIVQTLGLAARAAVLVCGDTTPHAKPHPAPLLAAARSLAVDPATCLYVGDDLRDIEAGLAAGMRTAAAAWGYLGLGEGVATWGADWVLDQPEALLQWLEMP
jgi:phosphoglycolate phosphatase